MDKDDYNPEEPIYYNYKAKKFLLAELPQYSMCYDNIYICSYDVNTEGKYPFLRFLFTRLISFLIGLNVSSEILYPFLTNLLLYSESSQQPNKSSLSSYLNLSNNIFNIET